MGHFTRCDVIYLPQLGFQPVAAVGKLVQKWERDSYVQQGETLHKKIHKQYINTEHTK